jgi:CRISPR system Cascade subunit CasD
MPAFLVFQLYGPMQSYGETAVGDIRPGFGHPTHSALTGLAAACLGMRRDEEERLKSLSSSFAFAVRVDREGTLLREYQTVQCPPSRKKGTYCSRRQELTEPKPWELNTRQTYRDFAMDALYTGCMAAICEPPLLSLEEVAAAMQKPVFIPYLGRRSSPLALPLCPQIINADTAREAFAASRFDRSFIEKLLKNSNRETRFAWAEELPAGLAVQHTAVRRDIPASRKTWSFHNRLEHNTIAPPQETQENSHVHDKGHSG